MQITYKLQYSLSKLQKKCIAHSTQLPLSSPNQFRTDKKELLMTTSRLHHSLLKYSVWDALTTLQVQLRKESKVRRREGDGERGRGMEEKMEGEMEEEMKKEGGIEEYSTILTGNTPDRK